MSASVDAAEEPEFYHHGASLRVFGNDVPFDEITARLGVEPTQTYRRGDRITPRFDAARPRDMWLYAPPVPEEREMGEHIFALRERILPHLDYLRSLKRRWTVDVYCTYTSNSSTAGFTVDQESLKLFLELDVPFGVSVVIVGEDR